MAQLASLEDWLQDPVLDGVLTLAQAWAMQDAHNLADPRADWNPLPPALWPVARTVWLYQHEGLTLQ